MKPLLATDAELFVLDRKSGLITSVAGLLGADKYNKKVITTDIRLQEDNVLMEFDINPHNTCENFVDNVKRAMQVSSEEADALGMEVVSNVCSHIYTAEELASFHKDAFLFGCEPDFNALSGTMNPRPTSTNPGLRTAGAHVHIGYDHIKEVDQQGRQIIGVMCDYFLGLPSLLLDTDSRRRELYGKAGSVRFKPYGVEYRTLSNFWLFNKDNQKFVWDQANLAFESFMSKSFSELIKIIRPEDVQLAINNNDRVMAEQYIKVLGVA